jgi:uncharacterized cupredoxin-like copper-binding protein
MHRLLVPGLLAGAIGLSACGSSNDSSGSSSSSGNAGGYGASTKSNASGAGQKVNLKADPDGSLYFEPRKLAAKAGVVTLVMADPSSSGKSHGIGIEGNGLDKDGQIVQPGSTSKITVTLKAGKYEYYCPVPAHKTAGMKGTLTVS